MCGGWGGGGYVTCNLKKLNVYLVIEVTRFFSIKHGKLQIEIVDVIYNEAYLSSAMISQQNTYDIRGQLQELTIQLM